MNKAIIIFFQVFFLSVFAQNYKITYEFSSAIETDTIKNIHKKRYYENHFLEASKNTFGVLYITSNGAIFEQEGNLRNRMFPERDFFKKVYSFKPQQKILFKNSPYSATKYDYYYKAFNDYKWEISTVFKMIDNYKCYKAQGFLYDDYSLKEIPVVAWFCPEIPFPYGPNDYAGLPGLIFEAYRLDGTDLHWKLKSIELNKTTKTQLIDPDNSEDFRTALLRIKQEMDAIMQDK
ncbi:GLPGLI family protein [Flavobacterium agricola]|uniref:GLPGLI family protein n=1 Tax=Flavobacterium agricola TaxID=2870839 RepID=A0ABY6LXA2_9FLAO|nr:GLPGLI family protein [Flavobacterium agricola]UYW00796.1 GLPGLI family protein [Flavobacterium agricola]